MHALVADGSVAAVVITDPLHRPYVTPQVMADHTARHADNEARDETPIDRFRRQTQQAGKSRAYAGGWCRGRGPGSTARHSST